jgi:hypothetical protein
MRKSKVFCVYIYFSDSGSRSGLRFFLAGPGARGPSPWDMGHCLTYFGLLMYFKLEEESGTLPLLLLEGQTCGGQTLLRAGYLCGNNFLPRRDYYRGE